MKRTVIYKIILITAMFFISIGMANNVDDISTTENKMVIKSLLYSEVWGSAYNANTNQCDDSPTITGDGSKIDTKRASQLRWIAISQDMLNCEYRKSLLLCERTNLYKGKIQYGDTVWIESSNEKINGWWVVHDTKNVRYKNSIDFLQSSGDGTLYSNETTWNGKFDDIKIYTLNNISYSDYQKYAN
jgi:3D (Asp-Asp-Asp) domain-containing protein